MFPICIYLISNTFLHDLATIDCVHTKDIPEDVLNTYCWIHSTYTIPSAFWKRIGGQGTEAPRAWWGWWRWLCRYWCCSPRHRQDNRPRGEEICQILPVGLLLPLLPGIHFQVGWSSAGVALMFGWMDYVRMVPHWWVWWIMVHLNSQFILILLQSHSRMSTPGHQPPQLTLGDTFILAEQIWNYFKSHFLKKRTSIC